MPALKGPGPAMPPPPYLAIYDGRRRVLVTSILSDFLGNRRARCRPLDELDVPFDAPLDAIATLVEPTEGPEGDILRWILADRWLDGGGTGATALRANVDHHPFQLRPLLKFYSTAGRRLLIADETGIGKTIEAGMIIAETLAAKPDEACIVVLCPASIIPKWRKELRKRFGINSNQGNLHRLKKELVRGSFPGVHVISDSSAPQEREMVVPEGSIDLLVIDEIHRYIGRVGAGHGSNRRGRCIDLSRAASGTIGLTATPIQIEVEDLQRILELLAPGEHPEQTFHADAELQRCVNRVSMALEALEPPDRGDVRRLEENWPVNSPLAAELLLGEVPEDDLGDLLSTVRSIGPIGRRLTRARASDPDVDVAHERIVTDHFLELGEHADLFQEIDDHLRNHAWHAHRQQLASCPGAAVGILNRFVNWNQPDNGADMWDDWRPDDEGDDAATAARALRDRAAIEMPNIGPKIQALQGLLADLSERDDITKAVVFTHWIPTHTHVPDIIRTTGYDTHIIRINDDPNVIESKLIRFAETDDFAVLFVTDRMSLGVDMEMANVVINMDLPYNPAVLQQRIGRLDRIIQRSPFIEVHNLILRGTIEERIHEVLAERADVFTGIIGEMEAIIEPDEAPTVNDEDARDILRRVRRDADEHQLARSDVLLRVMDSALDGIIGEQRRALHPLHARAHLIPAALMERLGGEADWDDEEGVLHIRMSQALRSTFLNSKRFLPWDVDEVRAAIEREDENGWVHIPMRGRDAILGPLHPFLSACISVTMQAEGMVEASLECDVVPRMQGKNEDGHRWVLVLDDDKEHLNSSQMIEGIQSETCSLGEWMMNDDEQCKCAWTRIEGVIE